MISRSTSVHDWTGLRGAAAAESLGYLLADWSSRPGTLSVRLAAALEKAIERGEIAPGARLPSERALAASLAISRTTVVAAYELLRQRGRAESRQGSGTRAIGGSGAHPGHAER